MTPVRRRERDAWVVRIRWHEIFWSIDTTASGELRGEIGNGYRMTLGLTWSKKRKYWCLPQPQHEPCPQLMLDTV